MYDIHFSKVKISLSLLFCFFVCVRVFGIAINSTKLNNSITFDVSDMNYSLRDDSMYRHLSKALNGSLFTLLFIRLFVCM